MTDLFSAPTPTRAPLPSRSSQRRSKASAAARRQRRRRRFTILVLALVVVAGAGWYVTQHVLPSFSFGVSTAAQDYEGPGSGSVDVRVQPGDTGRAIGATLEKAGVVASSKAFVDAYAANPAASSIQPGVYALKEKMRASDAVALLAAGTARVDLSVTVPEGYTVAQIVNRASVVTGIPEAEFKAAMKSTQKTGLPSQAKGNYEGWLFPATYAFDPDVTANEVVSQMVSQTVTQLDKLGVPKADRETVLIKASLIEREAKRPQDQPKMARVIENRLDRGMSLGIDAAIAYGLGKSGLDLTKSDLTDTSNPYNTRVHLGLPPGPIASPGASAIKAVLHPADGDWLFWVAVNLDTGETKFATTYDEHQANEKLLDAWMKAHPAK